MDPTLRAPPSFLIDASILFGTEHRRALSFYQSVVLVRFIEEYCAEERSAHEKWHDRSSTCRSVSISSSVTRTYDQKNFVTTNLSFIDQYFYIMR
jgi:hypothetical protein